MFLQNYFYIDLTRSKSLKKIAKIENQVLFIQNFMKYINMAMLRYSFEGLPDTISERVIKEAMIVYGNVTFFDYNGYLLALPGMPSGDGWNVNGDPVSAWVFARNGRLNEKIRLLVPGGYDGNYLQEGVTDKPILNPQGVMVWESENRFPVVNYIFYYAQAVSDTLRTMDTARVWLKTPSMPVAEESLVQSVADVFKKLKNNEEIIPVSTGIQAVDKFDLKPVGDITRNLQKATELVEWYDMQVRALLGLRANTASDKKGENLITDEVHINDAFTDSISDVTVDYINKQLELVNQKFGTNIRCVLNETIQSTEGRDDVPEEEEANDDNV